MSSVPASDLPPPGLSRRVRAAYERAIEDARWPAPEAVDDPAIAPERRVAIGDPQAPLERFLEILDRHDLLGADGRLVPSVHLVSMGDHFDWGPSERRRESGKSAVRLLSWLAAHPRSGVTILAGNHDLARVGELVDLDDGSFDDANAEASAVRDIPLGKAGRSERRHALLARLEHVPSLGVLLRDFATFLREQRTLVEGLLRSGRMQAAYAAAPDLLLIHAGVTRDDLGAIEFASDGGARLAPAIAEEINIRVGAAMHAWSGKEPFTLWPLYRPGSYESGEARGVFIQRPADPEKGEPSQFEGPPRRRYDPRGLVPGLTQVVGHIRDTKCRDLMPRWSVHEPAQDGPLRHLWTDGVGVRYRRGVPDDDARAQAAEGRASLIVFADGGMNHGETSGYELFDLDARRAFP